MAGATLSLMIFLTSFSCRTFAASHSLHLHVNSNDSTDQHIVNLQYNELFDLRCDLLKKMLHEKTTYRGTLKSLALSTSLSGHVTVHQVTPEHTSYTASAEGNVGPVRLVYSLSAEKGGCAAYQLSHSLTSEPSDLLYFSSNVTSVCGRDEHTLESITITIDLHGTLSPLLRTRLHQVFVFEDERMWEEMTMNNTLLDIRVNADWPDSRNGFKRAAFKSHNVLQSIPSFILEYVRREDESVLKLLHHLSSHGGRDEL